MAVRARVQVDARELRQAADELKAVERQASEAEARSQRLEGRGREARGRARGQSGGGKLAAAGAGRAGGAALGALGGFMAIDTLAEVMLEHLRTGRSLTRIVRDRATEMIPSLIRETIPDLIFETVRRELHTEEQRIRLRRDRRDLGARLDDDPSVRREVAASAGRYAKRQAAADFREAIDNPRGPRGSF